jgi:hypothetical protein
MGVPNGTIAAGVVRGWPAVRILFAFHTEIVDRSLQGGGRRYMSLGPDVPDPSFATKVLPARSSLHRQGNRIALTPYQSSIGYNDYSAVAGGCVLGSRNSIPTPRRTRFLSDIVSSDQASQCH